MKLHMERAIPIEFFFGRSKVKVTGDCFSSSVDISLEIAFVHSKKLFRRGQYGPDRADWKKQSLVKWWLNRVLRIGNGPERSAKHSRQLGASRNIRETQPILSSRITIVTMS